MKLPNFHIYKVLNEVIDVVTSKEKLKEVLNTRLYTNAFYLMFNTAVTSLLGFFFWLIVARFYTEAEVGFGSAIISALNLLAIISLTGLNISLVRFMPQAEKPEELINTCLSLSGVISLVTAGIFVAGLDWWSPALGFIKQNTIFCLTFLAFALFFTLSILTDSTFVAKRRASFVLSKNAIYSVLKLPFPILLVLFFRSFGIVASWGVAMCIALALSLFLFLPKIQNRYKPVPALNLSLLKDMWHYSSGNYLANLLSATPAFMLPVIVVNLLGAEQNAYFYIACMIAGLLFAIPSAVSLSLFAEGSHFEDKLRQNVTKSLKLIFLLLIPAIVVVILAGKWLLLAFGRNYSANALYLLRVLCLSSLPYGINNIYTGILRVTGRLKELIVIWGLMAVAVLLVSYLIIPSTGIIGIGYAWLGTQTAVALYILASRKLLALQ